MSSLGTDNLLALQFTLPRTYIVEKSVTIRSLSIEREIGSKRVIKQFSPR
jgi:hypothetical protein